MENKEIINNNDLKENIIEAEYDECNESVYLILSIYHNLMIVLIIYKHHKILNRFLKLFHV